MLPLLSLYFAPFTQDGKVCISDYLKVLVFSRLVEENDATWGKLHATWCFQKELRGLQWEIDEGNQKGLEEIYRFVKGRLGELEPLIHEGNPVGVIGVLLEDVKCVLHASASHNEESFPHSEQRRKAALLRVGKRKRLKRFPG